MTKESTETRSDGQAPGWAQALSDLEVSLQEAGRAVAALRCGLEGIGFNLSPAEAGLAVADEAPSRQKPNRSTTSVQEPREPGEATARGPRSHPASTGDAVEDDGPKGASFDRLWDKIERERTERAAPAEEVPDARRGLDLLPQTYLMTVEDREGRVSLVPLHRGLQGLPGIEEVNLVSYANGVPVISLRSTSALDLDTLGEVVGRVMDRDCEVIQQDMGKLYLRMKANSREEAL